MIDDEWLEDPIDTDSDDDHEWHASKNYSLKSNPYETIEVKETIMGCGIAQCYGISNFNFDSEEEVAKLFEEIKKEYRLSGVGAIMATLGEDYYNIEKYLFNLGFERLSEYSNYRHGASGNYKQTLYILKL